jgi:hypothetical protein
MILGITALLLCARPVWAWNSVGHMVVAKLAYDQLDQKRQLALYELLKGHPHYKDFLTASRPADLDNQVEWVVLRCAAWPDWVRPRKGDSRGTRVTRYHRSEDHYINIPFIDPKDEKFFEGKTPVNGDLANIISALKQRSGELKTKTAAAEDRAVAVCWIFHLVGDIHQPLHTTAYFSSDKAFNKGDLGGNKFGIRAEGQRLRLHAFWDDLLGADSDYANESAQHQGVLYREAVKVAQGLRGLELNDADNEKLAKNLTFESWARESYDLARTVVYRKADGNLFRPVEVKFTGEIPVDAEEVGKQYIQTARSTAEKQVVLAGKRLAERLKLLLP